MKLFAFCRHAALTAIAVGSVEPAGAQSSSTEWLAAVHKLGNWRIERLDATSGAELGVSYFPPPAPAGVRPTGLTWTGERLLTINTQSVWDLATTVHPANAQYASVGQTGFDLVTVAVERDPVSGAVYFTDRFGLYTLNPMTGSTVLVAPFSGFVHPQDGIYAMAVDIWGNAIGIGNELFHQNNTVYSIDLSTGSLNAIGEVQGIGGGWFRDIAIASDGMIWGSFYDVGLNPGARGLYKIDPTNAFTPTFIRHVADPHFGLAFVPANQQTEYCSAKLNSLGCAPTISGDGFPSPTASTGFWIRASNVRSHTAGALVISINGRTSVPFGGGTLCIAQPWRRTPLQSSGGSPSSAPDCSGTWSLDFNTWMNSNPGLFAGTSVQCQWLGRDPGFAAPGNWTLTDALEFTLRP